MTLPRRRRFFCLLICCLAQEWPILTRTILVNISGRQPTGAECVRILNNMLRFPEKEAEIAALAERLVSKATLVE
jgi:hypothetical protein